MLGGLKSTCQWLHWETEAPAELCIRSQLDLKFVLPANMREARVAHHFQVLSRQHSATAQRCRTCLAVKRKYPLFTVSVFEVADVTMSCIARNYRRITT